MSEAKGYEMALILGVIFVWFQLQLLISPASAYNKTYLIEAQVGHSNNAQKISRSEATSGIAVLLKQSGYLYNDFKVLPNDACTIDISSVRYSNDGISDTVELYLNGYKIGEIETREGSGAGNLWNVFLLAKPVGMSAVHVAKGINQLKLLVVTADEFGLEIDSVNVIADCSNSTGELIQVINNGSIEIRDDTPPPDPKADWALALSVINTCANIIMILVHVINFVWTANNANNN